MTYKTEFPDFEPPAIPADWIDQSWHNDVCPSWSVGAYRVWVDYADPSQREATDCARFRVTDDDVFEILFSSNAWGEILSFVALPAIEPDQDEEALTRLYTVFLTVTGLPEMSAEDLIFENLKPDQRAWLTRFIEAWEQMREDEKDWMKYAEQKAGIR